MWCLLQHPDDLFQADNGWNAVFKSSLRSSYKRVWIGLLELTRSTASSRVGLDSDVQPEALNALLSHGAGIHCHDTFQFYLALKYNCRNRQDWLEFPQSCPDHTSTLDHKSDVKVNVLRLTEYIQSASFTFCLTSLWLLDIPAVAISKCKCVMSQKSDYYLWRVITENQKWEVTLKHRQKSVHD